MRKFLYRCCILIFFGNTSEYAAQPVLERFDSVKVFESSTQLKNPWAGGINFTEWSNLDLNGDGVNDLVIFDKSGYKLRTFLCDKVPGKPAFTHAPQYQEKFPPTDGWCIFYDYDCDNKPDMFTYATGLGGIKVYKNSSSAGNLEFTLAKTLIKSNYFPGGSPQWYNLYCSQVAIPGLADIDKDGDMDILSFSTLGITIQYHKNQSMELYGKCDSLIFHMVDECWGDVDESTCVTNLNSTLNGCPPYQKYKEVVGDYSGLNDIRHAGSCILCLDADGDSDMDMILGDISCDSIEYFQNGGSTAYAHIDYTTKNFPPQKVATFKQFPCSYFLDIDNDKKRDLIAAPNMGSGENSKSVWWYKNVRDDSHPDFQFMKNNFLQDEMIEVGEGAFPAAFDYEGDGDLDLLVGNFGYYTPGNAVGNYTSQLALYLNTGTATKPEFTLQTRDFFNLSAVNTINKTPALADFDNDGDIDLFLGSYDGRLSYYNNTAGPNTPPNFVLASDFSMTGTFLAGKDIGNTSAPFAVDVDRDGVKDLLVGGRDGYISYFRNSGSPTNPTLTLVSAKWGGVKTIQQNYSTIGNSMPFLWDNAGKYLLLVGSERGYVYLFGNIESNINSGNFTLIDSIYVNDIVEGGNVAPCMHDFNKDGLADLILGNYSGGLAYFRGTGYTGINEQLSFTQNINVYPNPAQQQCTIQFNNYDLEEKSLSLLDALGRPVKMFLTTNNKVDINLEQVESGLYFLQVTYKNLTIPGRTFKLIIENK